MNRRRYDNSGRFDKSSDNYNRKNYSNARMSTSNSKEEYRGRYSSSSSKYFDDSKYNSFRHSYKSSSGRSGDRIKRSRNDDSRLNSNFMSTHRRNDIRPKTPPPPTIRSSGSSYNRGTNRNDNSTYRNTYSPSRRRPHLNMSGPRNTTYRYNSRIRPAIHRDTDVRPKIIRRKIIVSTSRKLNTFRNDRSRVIRLARMKRNRDSLKSKTTPSKKSSKEEDNIDDGEQKNMKSSPKNESVEDEDTDAKTSKKNGQDEKEEKEDDDDKPVDTEKNPEEKVDEHSKKGVVDYSTSRRHRFKKSESVSSERKPRPFIKLICVHCRIKSRTFSDYQSHLYSRTHHMAMRRVSIRQKAQLSRMRLDQRNAQRELEENSKEDLGEQQYCLLCRLNYKTGKAKHQISDHHKTMKKFLMPYCSTCHIAFKSPTVYQSHRCSLDHIKRKARDNKSDSEDSGSEMKVDLKDFTTVDSIGEIDVDDLDESDNQLDISELDDESLGLKHVKKVEALYCETCENYISHDLTTEEEIILKHCKTRIHLKLTRKNRENDQIEMDKEPTILNQSEESITKEETGDSIDYDMDTNKNDDSVGDGTQAEKSQIENNDEDDDEDDETILNIDILSEKNCNDNGIIEETTNNVAE